jgi:hypothetical protein
MKGRVDSEPEAGDPMPYGKMKFLSIMPYQTKSNAKWNSG